MQANGNLNRVVLAALDKQLAALECGRYRLKVPAPLGLMRSMPKSHLHFIPEVFIQISGYTDFCFPREQMRLLPGEMCVIAVGLPHVEVGRSWRGPFLNMVISFTSTSLSWHLAKTNKVGSPKVGPEWLVKTTEATRANGYLADLVEAYHTKAPARNLAVRGLAMAFLAAVRMLMEGDSPARSSESYKVTQCRHIIMQNIGDPELNVKKLAARIKCSPDYLSNLFHHETGITLIAYIQRQRVHQAKSLLDSSSLNISEVGCAIGYDDPGYFARIFKRITGQTPKQYRNRRATRRASQSRA